MEDLTQFSPHQQGIIMGTVKTLSSILDAMDERYKPTVLKLLNLHHTIPQEMTELC